MPGTRTITFFHSILCQELWTEGPRISPLPLQAIRTQGTCFRAQKTLPLMQAAFCFTSGDGTEDRYGLTYLLGAEGTVEPWWTSVMLLALTICQGCPVTCGYCHGLQTLLTQDASQDLGTKANQTQPLSLDRSGVLNIFLASEAALCVSDSQTFPVNVSFGSLLLLKIALVPISYA